jgi:flagellar hook assembly protein FlgD
VLRKLPIVVALAGLLVSSAAAATSAGGVEQQAATTSSLLMPGVTYDRQVDFTPRGPVVLDVVTAPRPDGSLYALEPLLSNDALVATDRVTAMEQALSTTATVVGVNGDYFTADPGTPSGMLMRGGVLDSEPAAGRSSLGIAGDGTLSVADVRFDGSWQGTDQRRALDLNAKPANGHTTLYTDAWGPQTPAESGVVEAVLQSFPPARPNGTLEGTVTQVTGAGPTTIPRGGAVLVSRGSQGPHLSAEAPVGTTVRVRLTLTPDWSGMVSALGGGPPLVVDGTPVFNAGEAFGAGLLNRRNARSAVGQLADGRILLVTVEGGTAAYSVGMTNYELGVALARLGAVRAMALGTGAPASMSFDGTLVSRPSLVGEQQVADALVLAYTGVYAPPPTVAVLSPNGDGVDETQSFTIKVVRPSHVTATLTGPDGSTRTLVDEDEQPGVRVLGWDGKTAEGAPAAEGTWRFSVTATDDRGVRTTAERDFALDETLGTLQVSPAAAKLAPKSKRVAVATFQLTRDAHVVATVEKRSGIVIATLLDADLGAGAQTVSWNGRDWRGALAFTGAYQVRVTATSSVGEVSLTAPFTARR